MIKETRPQRITRLESTLKGDIDVSSVEGEPSFGLMPLDETCVFFRRDHHSEIMGHYDDHDHVVEEMMRKYDATVRS